MTPSEVAKPSPELPQEEIDALRPRLFRRGKRWSFVRILALSAALLPSMRDILSGDRAGAEGRPAAALTDVQGFPESPEPASDEEAVPLTIEFDGRTYDQESFDSLLLEAQRLRLGSLADDCAGAEQCYYYYGNQLKMEPGPVAQLTGRSVDELRWIGTTLRSGFVQQPGLRFPGTYVGVVEAGRTDFPPIASEQRDVFYRAQYERARTQVADFYADLRIADQSPAERRELGELAGAVAKAETELAVRTARMRWSAEHRKDFADWFAEGIGAEGHASGDAKWDAAFAAYRRALERLHAYATAHPLEGEDGVFLRARGSFALVRAEEAYRSTRRDLFDALHAQAAGSTFGSDRAEQWAARVQGEDARMRELRTRLGVIEQQLLALAE